MIGYNDYIFSLEYKVKDLFIFVRKITINGFRVYFGRWTCFLI